MPPLWADLQVDATLRGLVVMNALVVFGVLASGEGAMALMLPYWIQSVVIGLYTVRRIGLLKRFVTDGVRVAGRIVAPTRSLAPRIAFLFLIHYGFFHLLYFEMMGGFEALGYQGKLFMGSQWPATGPGPFTSVSGIWIAVSVVGFLVSEGREHAQVRAEDDASRPHIFAMMFKPYLRVVPMHFTIIVGAQFGGWGAVMIFGALKTAVEVMLYRKAHERLARLI